MKQMNIDIPANALVLHYLAKDRPGPAPAERPDAFPNAYLGLGCHPDIVERIWDQLGRALPVDCRYVVWKTPALVHPGSGLILALGMGTQYALRLSAADHAAAVRAGLRASTTWAGGKTTDLPATLGPDWLFGGWARGEPAWCLKVFQDSEGNSD